jgi:hypothetical protein
MLNFGLDFYGTCLKWLKRALKMSEKCMFLWVSDTGSIMATGCERISASIPDGFVV